jgi:hypothetical protein
VSLYDSSYNKTLSEPGSHEIKLLEIRFPKLPQTVIKLTYFIVNMTDGPGVFIATLFYFSENMLGILKNTFLKSSAVSSVLLNCKLYVFRDLEWPILHWISRAMHGTYMVELWVSINISWQMTLFPGRWCSSMFVKGNEELQWEKQWILSFYSKLGYKSQT